MLLTPDGVSAESTDRIMLLYMWASYVAKTASDDYAPVIFAGIGKPSFPINTEVIQSALLYWDSYLQRSKKARALLTDSSLSPEEMRGKIAKFNSALGYGAPQGEEAACQKMAAVLSRWYETPIAPEHLLFTVGGAAALHNIFEVINQVYPFSRIITPFPYYSLYPGIRNKNRLHPINVMDLPGYRLTAKAVEEAILSAQQLGEKDGGMPSAFLLCDPNNPLGTLMTINEALEVAEVLKRYPDLLIILDEAYVEMCFIESSCSLLRIAPELKNRIILMRSATKGLSSAGERMAVTVAFDPTIKTKLVEENIAICGHAPKSLQFAFAEAVEKLDEVELENLRNHYGPQVELVSIGLKEIGAEMPDTEYKIGGTFYILGDFSDLFGLALPEITEKALNKKGFIETDEDIVYYLLFTYKIMIAPLSYFGGNSQLGYLRITCSDGDDTLKTLLQRLEICLIDARKIKFEKTSTNLYLLLNEIKTFNTEKYEVFNREYEDLVRQAGDRNALQLKKTNLDLEKMLLDVTRYLNTSIESRQHDSALKIQRFFRGVMSRNKTGNSKEIVEDKWQQFIDIIVAAPHIRHSLYHVSAKDRMTFFGWEKFLSESNEMLTNSQFKKQ